MMHYDFRSGNSKISNVRISPLEIFPFHSDFELVDLQNKSYMKKYIKFLVGLSQWISRICFSFLDENLFPTFKGAIEIFFFVKFFFFSIIVLYLTPMGCNIKHFFSYFCFVLD